MHNLKIARVRWLDAAHYRSTEDIEWLKHNACGCEMTTVGHVIRSNNKDIVLAHEITDDSKARDTSIIPRKMVIEMQYLKEKK